LKVAIPLFENRISPRLDCAKRVLLVDIVEKDRQVVSSEEKTLSSAGMGENSDFYRINKIDVVICGGISTEMESFLSKRDVRVISWVTGEAQKALNFFLQGKLVSGAMLCPGMRMRRWRFCCHRGEENPLGFKKS